MNSEEIYRKLVKITLDRRKFDNFTMHGVSICLKQLTWLRCMGLMETWDIHK